MFAKAKNKAISAVAGADFLSSGFSLTFAGNEILATFSGGVLSLIVIGICIFSMIRFFQEYMDTSGPTVLRTLTISSSYPEFDLWAYKFTALFTIRLVSAGSSYLKVDEIPKFVTPVAYIQNI